MFTGVNCKGSGESGTVHTRIRIPYVSIKSCGVQLLKIAIKASTRDLGTYRTCANVTNNVSKVDGYMRRRGGNGHISF